MEEPEELQGYMYACIHNTMSLIVTVVAISSFILLKWKILAWVLQMHAYNYTVI